MSAIDTDVMRMAREQMYNASLQTAVDIHEHLPLLRELASKCRHVTEFGMRWANGSTVALLAAQPEVLVSWDLDPFSVVSQQVANLLAVKGRTRFEPRCGNTLEIAPIEPTDMLFIDTLHTAKQLQAELAWHVDPERGVPVRKYLVFHDTSTFGWTGEDGSEPGLRTAIRWFQKEFAFPLWLLTHDRDNNNGLVVLERVE